MEKSGFYVHCVDEPSEECFNAHTHGFKESWGHTDFQIVLPISTNIIMGIMHTIASRIRDGEVLEAGTTVERIIKSLPVRLERAAESNREVIRVILPDSAGRFPGDYGVDQAYDRQVYVLGGIIQKGENA